MEKIYNDVIKESLYFDTLENGMDIYYIPKKGFKKKYAILGVDFGSNDLEFISIDKGEKVRVNEGIAHFLEHKMFEQPDGNNAFDKFSKLGASANAFTSFTMTAYLFSAIENFYELLSHLINYVKTPYYTDENVEKEKGIIEQEIKMYQDNPQWNVYYNCIKSMYSNHHIRIDVAGSVESIYKITPEELYTCYNTFYNPANMKLFVVGDLDNNKLFDVVNSFTDKERKSKNNIKRFMPKEPKEVYKKRFVDEFPISAPIFYIGYKDEGYKLEGKELLKNEIVSDILYDLIFSESGELYYSLYKEGFIYESFSGGYLPGKDFSHTLVSGVSKDPDEVKLKIDKYIENIRKKGLKLEDFEIAKKGKIGLFLSSFDSISFLANNFLSYSFRDINFLDYLEVLKSIKFDDVENRLKTLFLEEYSSISIIKPKTN